MEMVLFVVLVVLLVLVITILVPLLISVAIVRWIQPRAGGVIAAIVAAILVVAWVLSPVPRVWAYIAYAAVPAARIPIATADLAMSRAAREDVVQQLAAGRLDTSDRGDFYLPPGARGLSVHGTVQRISGQCGVRVFFMTLTGFSPDPYAGFEFVPEPCEPELDPLGSGHGQATPLGDGWYWIEAR